MNHSTTRRAARLGIGGPVGSGKNMLVLRLCQWLREELSIVLVTNDIHTREDAEFLAREEALAPGRFGDGADVVRKLHDLQQEEVWVGSSRLGERVLCVRVLAQDAPTLRAVQENVRANTLRGARSAGAQFAAGGGSLKLSVATHLFPDWR